MGKLLDLLKASTGEASLFSKLGLWRQRVSAEVDTLSAVNAAARTSGGISYYTVSGAALTGPFVLDTWTTLAPEAFLAGDLSADLVAAALSLQYAGVIPKLLTVRAGLSLVATGVAVRENYELGLFRNGSLIVGSSAELQSVIGQAASFNAGHTTSQISVILQPLDVIDIRLRQRMDGGTPTLLASAYLVIAE